MIRVMAVSPDDVRLVHRPFAHPAELAGGHRYACNFSFFAPGERPVAVGGAAQEGRLLVPPDEGSLAWPTLYLEPGQARIGPWSEAQALGARFALQAGPQVLAGWNLVAPDERRFPGTRLTLALPRTGVGIAEGPRCLLVVAVAQAATALDMGNLFAALGCRDAMLADGGGSATWVEGGRAQIGGARKVPNVLAWDRGKALDPTGQDVCLDPGHGGTDPGAVGHGLRESDLNLDVAKRAKDYLEGAGVSCRLTRYADAYRSLAHRVTLGAGCRLFISVHHNWHGRPAVEGIETYHYPGSKRGRSGAAAAEYLLRLALSLPSRGVSAANYYVLRETPMPAVLTEAGYLSSPADAGQLRWEWFRDREALALAVAACRALDRL